MQTCASATEPDVLTAEAVPQLKWGECDEEALVAYLVGEKNFSEDRVRSSIRKLNANKGKSSQGIQCIQHMHVVV